MNVWISWKASTFIIWNASFCTTMPHLFLLPLPAWRVRNLVKFIAASPSGGSSRSARRRTSPACPTTWRCSTASYRLGNQLFSNTTCAWAHFTSFVFLQNRSLFYLSLMFIRVHKSESIDPCRLAGLDILKQAHVTMLVCIPLIFLQHGGGCK